MIIDLTMDVSEETFPFPGCPGAEICYISTVDEGGSNVKKISLNSHFGTHVDAPYHMLADGKKLDEYDANTFVGQASIVDVVGKKQITEEHVPSDISVPILIFKTRHSNNYKSQQYFSNNPVLTKDAAEAIARTGVKIVGLDSFTVDNKPYTVHKILFKKNILILENLVGLDKLGEHAKFIVAPLKLTNADGAPARVFAEV
ncbi:MAG: cyclase family protein [Pseudomonadota bacterium]